MMENNERDRSKSNANRSDFKSFKTLFVKNYINAIRKKEKRKKEEEKPTEIKESNTKIKRTEIVDVIFTIILAAATVVLAYFTFQLFNETKNARIDNKEAITAAQNSSTAAQNTVIEQRLNDSTVRRNDSIKFINDTTYANKKFFNDSIISKINSEIASNTLNAQINSLKQAQTDFETENQPFLQLQTPIHIDTIGIKIPIIASYQIKNLGKYPVKIIEDNNVSIARHNIPSFDSIFNKNRNRFKANYVNSYITYDSPLQERSQTPFNLDSAYYNAIRFKGMPIYQLGYIKYLNLVTNKTWEYDYMVRTTFLSFSYTNDEFIINENKNITK